ncbi:extracellular solute-binding protein [Paenibacillus turpanensis]|uniref:extracellular solute-binding protein n=1 Tax=Paenibacillus turpanensis TaxID=2689078 RepID=UPI00140D712E|nr:extracellular solute-binding protein [Paenibacillus turpanensis]
MRQKQKRFIVLSSVLTLSMLAAACSGGGSAPQQGSSSSGSGSTGDGKQAPTDVSVMVHFLTQQPAADDNPVKKLIEEATNTKLNIQWVSSNNYTDKLNVTLASGDIPDLVFINDPFSPVFRNMTAQGAFWEVGPYIKDYANLSSGISKTAWDLTKMADGKNYVVPRPRPSEADSFFIVRKDWLDKLNLKVPTTTDELYEVMKAFVEKDPDGNGKADTIGLAANTEPQNTASPIGTLGHIENSFTGVNGKWKWVDGKMVHNSQLPEMKQALEYMVKAYQEKLIPADFASLKNTQVLDLFKANKAGIVIEKAGSMKVYYDPLKKLVPEIKETDFYPVTNINGYNPKSPGFAGALAIPKKVPEEKMKKILQMIDTWMKPEVFQFQQYGIEGVHHTVKDGQKVIDTEKMNADSVPDFNQIVYVADPYASSTKIFFSEETNKLYKQIQDERAKTSSADLTVGLFSPTAQTSMAEIEKKLADLKTKIILGREPMSKWDEMVESLKNDATLKKISEEYTDAYKKRTGQ